MRICAYGYSDDTAIIEWNDKNSIDRSSVDCYDRPVFAEVRAGGEGIILAFNYVGIWAVGIAQVDEGVPLPDWAEMPHTQMIDEGEYTIAFELESVPDDVTVRWFFHRDGGRREWVE